MAAKSGREGYGATGGVVVETIQPGKSNPHKPIDPKTDKPLTINGVEFVGGRTPAAARKIAGLVVHRRLIEASAAKASAEPKPRLPKNWTGMTVSTDITNPRQLLD